MVAQGARSAGGCRRRKAVRGDGTKKEKKRTFLQVCCRSEVCRAVPKVLNYFSTVYPQYLVFNIPLNPYILQVKN